MDFIWNKGRAKKSEDEYWVLEGVDFKVGWDINLGANGIEKLILLNFNLWNAQREMLLTNGNYIEGAFQMAFEK